MEQHVCPWWLAYTFDNPLRKLIHSPTKIMSPYVDAGMTAADIGCGMGYFSLGLAQLVGPGGRVFSADLQPEMLARVEKRAGKKGLSAIVTTVQSGPAAIGIDTPVDFALAFWMIHETPDPKAFFRQIHGILKPGGRLLMTEPRFHVDQEQFEAELAVARQAGFKLESSPKITFCRAALLTILP